MSTSFSVTTHIAASPGQVFAFLADPSTAPVIDPAVVRYEPEGGTMGLGVRNRIRSRIVGIPVTLVSETVEWEPGRTMSFRSVSPATPVAATATHRFERDPLGTTYTWSMDFRPVGRVGPVAARLAAWFFRRNAVAQQARVRAVLEAAVRLPASD